MSVKLLLPRWTMPSMLPMQSQWILLIPHLLDLAATTLSCLSSLPLLAAPSPLPLLASSLLPDQLLQHLRLSSKHPFFPLSMFYYILPLSNLINSSWLQIPSSNSAQTSFICSKPVYIATFLTSLTSWRTYLKSTSPAIITHYRRISSYPATILTQATNIFLLNYVYCKASQLVSLLPLSPT